MLHGANAKVDPLNCVQRVATSHGSVQSTHIAVPSPASSPCALHVAMFHIRPSQLTERELESVTVKRRSVSGFYCSIVCTSRRVWTIIMLNEIICRVDGGGEYARC